MPHEERAFGLSPQQRRLWAWHRRGWLPLAQVGVTIDGELDEARLRGSVQRVIDAHAALRTRFQELAGTLDAAQVVHDRGAAAWRTAAQPEDADVGGVLRAERDAVLRLGPNAGVHAYLG